MSYVSRDEMCDTIEENVRAVSQGLDKQLEEMQREMAKMEQRVERYYADKREKVVLFPPATNAVTPKEFAQAQDDIDTLMELTRGQTTLIRALFKSVTEMYEEMQVSELDAA